MSASSSSSYIPRGDHRAIERAVLGVSPNHEPRDATTGLSLTLLNHLHQDTHLPTWLGRYHGEMIENTHLADTDASGSPFVPKQTWTLKLGSYAPVDPRTFDDDEKALSYATVDFYAGFMSDQKCLFRFPLAKMSKQYAVSGTDVRLGSLGYENPRLERFGNISFTMEIRPKDKATIDMMKELGAEPNNQDDILLTFYLDKGITGMDPNGGMFKEMAARRSSPPEAQRHLEMLHQYLLSKSEPRERNELRLKVRSMKGLMDSGSEGVVSDFGVR